MFIIEHDKYRTFINKKIETVNLLCENTMVQLA